MVKTETQCKLYEEELKKWEKKCFELEKELQSVKLKMATESEHWHTIEALFGVKKIEKKPGDNTEDMNKLKQQSTKEIGCNTDNSPIPAERKLSTEKSRKVSKEMVDKNMSPIPSPKKKTLNERSTQTERYNSELKQPSVDIEGHVEKGKSLEQEGKESKSEATGRETSEAEIQTSIDLVTKDSKSIQTVDEENNKRCDVEKTVKETEYKEALEKLQKSEER